MLGDHTHDTIVKGNRGVIVLLCPLHLRNLQLLAHSALQARLIVAHLCRCLREANGTLAESLSGSSSTALDASTADWRAPRTRTSNVFQTL